MRKDLLSAAVAAILLLAGDAFARQNAQGQPSQNQAQQSQQSQQAPPSSAPASASPASAPAAAQGSSSQSTVVSPPPQQDALVAAARKAREQKKDQAGAKPPRVFNNDNIPTAGGVSAVGQNPPEADGTNAAAGAAPAPAAGASAGSDEKTWRKRFADLRKKLEQDQTDLDLMQRELGVLDVQYYNDPVKSMQQGYSRSDINEKTDKIEAKKKAIEADQQAIADAEDELQKAGGDPGWAR
jgi:glucose/arabinose dehydrogenase